MKSSHTPQFDPLDEEEKDPDNLERAKALPIEVREAILAPYRAEGRKNVTMRLSFTVIDELKRKAALEGIPYQTLASMVLQKYARGALLDREAVREVVQALKA